MAKLFALVLVALCAAQASQAQLVVPRFGSTIQNLLQRLSNQYSAQLKDVHDRLAQRLHSANASITAAIAAARQRAEQQQEERQAAQEERQAAQECYAAHSDEIQQLQQEYADQTNDCVSSNSGNLPAATEKLRTDLESYRNASAAALQSATKCSLFDYQCYAAAANASRQIQEQYPPILRADGVAVREAAAEAGQKIRACQQNVNETEGKKLVAIEEEIQQCITEKVSENSSGSSSNTVVVSETSA